MGKRYNNFLSGKAVIEITQGRKPTEDELNFKKDKAQLSGNRIKEDQGESNVNRGYVKKPVVKKILPTRVEIPAEESK